MKFTSLIIFIFVSLSSVFGFHFYLKNGERECFPQDSPENFVIKGKFSLEEWREHEKRLIKDPSLTVQITVDDLSNNNRIMNQKGTQEGRFSYTVVNPGRQNICFLVKSGNPQWSPYSRIRVTLDMAIQEDEDFAKASEKMNVLQRTLVDLNNKIKVIRKEQLFQRERESLFNKTNVSITRRILFWAVMQIILICAVCYWQLRHLRRFFEAKKLV
ncbi:hypothetical protein BB559_003402 [Furculomyces boomerangus]|uniref:GOLD domain-containing protein n=2 Tax=Harpellales TaxID=61421 RepID=A0A2T9YLE0_9FUNG|nr:hypothetical protein BB559_003402 [Furculomyces boomerangus]PVZ99514.1 hypothetical protein BB558_004408 [Smittium angustum]